MTNFRKNWARWLERPALDRSPTVIPTYTFLLNIAFPTVSTYYSPAAAGEPKSRAALIHRQGKRHMELSEIRYVRLVDGDGVTFKYLVLTLTLGEEKRSVLRGLNYLPAYKQIEEQIIRQTKEELDGVGFFAAGGDFVIDGGGSLTLNPYDETACLFGTNTPYGPETDREATARMVQTTFSNHKVSWFPAEQEESNQSSEKAGG